MPQNRYFIDQDIFKDDTVFLKNMEMHHLKVLRKKKEDFVEIINGKDILAEGIIQEIKKDHTKIFIQKVTKKKIRSNLVLLQPLMQFSKLKLITEKACELGIDEIIFFPSENSLKNLSKNQMEKLKKTVISSVKQCGRLSLLTLLQIKNIKNIPSISFYADINGIKTPPPLKGEKIFFTVGPEKGFSKEEIQYMQNISAQPISLSKNILKAETASITICTIFSYLKNL